MKRQHAEVCGQWPFLLPGLVTVVVAVCLPMLTPRDLAADPPRLQWSELPALPNPVGLGGPIVGVLGDMLVVAGGANFPGDPPWSVAGRPAGTKVWHKEVHALQQGRTVLDVGNGPWRWGLMDELPYPLAYAATVSTSEGIYVLGGESYGWPANAATPAERPTNSPTSEVLRIGMLPNSYRVSIARRALPDLPRPCQYHAAELVGSKVFVAASHAASPQSLRLDSKSFWSIDLAHAAELRQWEELPVWPGPAREKMALVAQAARSPESATRQHLYLIGGSTWAKHADGTPDDAHATHFTDGYCYDPLLQTWTTIANLPFVPERRQIDTAGYLWDADANAWVPAAEARSLTSAQHEDLFRSTGRPLGAAPAIAWGDRYILLFSGATGRYVTWPVQARPDFPRDVLSYDTQTDAWSVAGEMPSGVVTTSAVRWRGQIVIPSGETRPGIRTPRVQAARAE